MSRGAHHCDPTQKALQHKGRAHVVLHSMVREVLRIALKAERLVGVGDSQTEVARDFIQRVIVLGRPHWVIITDPVIAD